MQQLGLTVKVHLQCKRTIELAPSFTCIQFTWSLFLNISIWEYMVVIDLSSPEQTGGMD